MRLFVALNPAGAVPKLLRNVAKQLSTTGVRTRWLSSKSYHVTLLFLGEVEARAQTGIAHVVKEVAARHTIQRLQFGPLLLLPNRRPRVVCVGVVPNAELLSLRADLESGLDSLGFPPEGRSFRAHLTLGRVQGDLGPADVRALRAVAETLDYPGPVEIGSVDLMRSRLPRSGARYEILVSGALNPVSGDAGC